MDELEANVPENYAKTVSTDGLTVTNTLTAGKLIITKKVNKSDYSEQTFTFTVNGQTQTITVPKAASGSVHTANSAEIVLPAGEYTVTETDASKNGYTVTGEGSVKWSGSPASPLKNSCRRTSSSLPG